MTNPDVSNTSASSVDTPDEGTPLAVGEVQDPQKNADEGQIQAIQAERERRQTAERERDDALRAQEYYRGIAETQQVPESQDDPEEWATQRNVAEIVAKEVGKVQQQGKQERNQEQWIAANAKYPDFKEVFKLAEDVARGTPGLEDVIMSSANPAETAYKLGKTHDSYAEKVKTKATADVVEKINDGMNQPSTLSNVGAANNIPQNDSEKLKAMSDDEFEEHVHKVKTGQLLSP